MYMKKESQLPDSGLNRGMVSRQAVFNSGLSLKFHHSAHINKPDSTSVSDTADEKSNGLQTHSVTQSCSNF